MCRSEAEYKTLLYLLSSGAKKNWGSKIGSSKKGNFYFRNWLFVEEADLNTNQIYFKFNIPKNKCDVFHIKVEIYEEHTGKTYSWEDNQFVFEDSSLRFILKDLKRPECYRVKMFFDQQIMFADKFEDTELPF